MFVLFSLSCRDFHVCIDAGGKQRVDDFGAAARHGGYHGGSVRVLDADKPENPRSAPVGRHEPRHLHRVPPNAAFPAGAAPAPGGENPSDGAGVSFGICPDQRKVGRLPFEAPEEARIGLEQQADFQRCKNCRRSCWLRTSSGAPRRIESAKTEAPRQFQEFMEFIFSGICRALSATAPR